MVLDRAEIDENYRRVYLEGKTGSLEGLIFSNYELVDEMPAEFKWKCYGMDFGYTNDPSTIIDVRLANGALWVDELLYETGLLNTPNPMNKPNLVDEIKKNKIPLNAEIIADSAERKSIDEIICYGFNNLFPAIKGTDSIRQSINVVQRYPIKITKRSINMIREIRNYRWAKDNKGNTLEKPIDELNHCLDPLRYVAQWKFRTGSYNIKGTRI
jgi:phage terminase large subunit